MARRKNQPMIDVEYKILFEKRNINLPSWHEDEWHPESENLHRIFNNAEAKREFKRWRKEANEPLIKFLDVIRNPRLVKIETRQRVLAR